MKTTKDKKTTTTKKHSRKLSKIGEYWEKTGKNIIEDVTIVDMKAVLK